MSTVLSLIQLIVSIYDYLTLPVYYLLQCPSSKISLNRKIRAKRSDNYVWTRTAPSPPTPVGGNEQTMPDIMRQILKTYAPKKCLGTRPLMAEKMIEVNGKLTLKNTYHDYYDFLTYEQVDSQITSLASGFLDLGVKVSFLRH